VKTGLTVPVATALLVMYAEDSARGTHWQLHVSAAIPDLHREQTSAQLLVSQQQVVTTYHCHPFLSTHR